jgi:spoIIIJ-associated protein
MSTTDSIEISAASVEEAIREALEQLGATENEVTIEVLKTPRSGVLGLGIRQARVRVTRRQAAAGSTARPTETSSQPRTASSAQTAPEAQRSQPRPPRRDSPRGPGPAQNTEGAPARNRAQESRRQDSGPRGQDGGARREVDGSSIDEGGGARKSAGLEEQSREAIEILVRILELMGEKGEVHQSDSDPESVELEIKGDGSGILIGRHGQTLDALEYVVNRILTRRIKDAAPISLETESYRARRRGQLHRMALSMGERAKREHEPVRLDPMPPRDRRVVHLALKDDPMISTRSAGEGFLRSIEIVPADSGGRRERPTGGQVSGRRREREREPEREREREPERGNEALGEQGGFKHGQKRIV